MGRSTLNSPFRTFFAYNRPQRFGALPDSFIELFKGGPSEEVPPTTVLCLSGVSEAWLFSALFQKALLLFRFSERLPFRNGPTVLQHCCNSAVASPSCTGPSARWFPDHKMAQDVKTVTPM